VGLLSCGALRRETGRARGNMPLILLLRGMNGDRLVRSDALSTGWGAGLRCGAGPWCSDLHLHALPASTAAPRQ
jgi:hypothetical protein